MSNVRRLVAMLEGRNNSGSAFAGNDTNLHTNPSSLCDKSGELSIKPCSTSIADRTIDSDAFTLPKLRGKMSISKVNRETKAGTDNQEEMSDTLIADKPQTTSNMMQQIARSLQSLTKPSTKLDIQKAVVDKEFKQAVAEKEIVEISSQKILLCNLNESGAISKRESGYVESTKAPPNIEATTNNLYLSESDGLNDNADLFSTEKNSLLQTSKSTDSAKSSETIVLPEIPCHPEQIPVLPMISDVPRNISASKGYNAPSGKKRESNSFLERRRHNPQRKATKKANWRFEPDTEPTRRSLRSPSKIPTQRKVTEGKTKRRKTLDISGTRKGLSLGTILQSWGHITAIHKELQSRPMPFVAQKTDKRNEPPGQKEPPGRQKPIPVGDSSGGILASLEDHDIDSTPLMRSRKRKRLLEKNVQTFSQPDHKAHLLDNVISPPDKKANRPVHAEVQAHAFGRAFDIFYRERVNDLSLKNPDLTADEIFALVKRGWKSTSHEEKRLYQEQAMKEIIQIGAPKVTAPTSSRSKETTKQLNTLRKQSDIKKSNEARNSTSVSLQNKRKYEKKSSSLPFSAKSSSVTKHQKSFFQPKTPAVRDKNGLFIKPAGRPLTGYSWNVYTGLWTPATKNSATDSFIDTDGLKGDRQEKGTTELKVQTISQIPAESQDDDCPHSSTIINSVKATKHLVDKKNVPKSVRKDKDGNYVRPPGRPPLGYAWNNRTGVWEQLDGMKLDERLNSSLQAELNGETVKAVSTCLTTTQSTESDAFIVGSPSGNVTPPKIAKNPAGETLRRNSINELMDHRRSHGSPDFADKGHKLDAPSVVNMLVRSDKKLSEKANESHLMVLEHPVQGSSLPTEENVVVVCNNDMPQKGENAKTEDAQNQSSLGNVKNKHETLHKQKNLIELPSDGLLVECKSGLESRADTDAAALANTEDGISDTSKMTLTNTALFRKPRGRAPVGCIWNATTGCWIRHAEGLAIGKRSLSLPYEDVNSSTGRPSPDISKTSGNFLHRKDKTRAQDHSSLHHRKSPIRSTGSDVSFRKPKGRPRLGYTWDSMRGQWIQSSVSNTKNLVHNKASTNSRELNASIAKLKSKGDVNRTDKCVQVDTSDDIEQNKSPRSHDRSSGDEDIADMIKGVASAEQSAQYVPKFLACGACIGCKAATDCGNCFNCVIKSEYVHEIESKLLLGHSLAAVFRPLCALRICLKPCRNLMVRSSRGGPNTETTDNVNDDIPVVDCSLQPAILLSQNQAERTCGRQTELSVRRSNAIVNRKGTPYGIDSNQEKCAARSQAEEEESVDFHTDLVFLSNTSDKSKVIRPEATHTQHDIDLHAVSTRLFEERCHYLSKNTNHAIGKISIQSENLGQDSTRYCEKGTTILSPSLETKCDSKADVDANIERLQCDYHDDEALDDFFANW